MLKNFTIVFLILSSITLSAQKEYSNQCNVKKVTGELIIDGTQVFYALPKNVIRIEIEVRKTISQVGPYAVYAEKLLNISEGVVNYSSSSFDIANVEAKRYSKIDSTNIYAISNVNPFNMPAIQLSPTGCILACNANEVVACSNVVNPVSIDFGELEIDPFLDLGIKPFEIKESTTLYKTVRTDSTETKVPYKSTKLKQTTTEANAHEAADYIRKIRKRKMKLMYADAAETNAVDGKAVKVLIDKLEESEKAYLELFVGREYTMSKKHYFDYEPSSNVSQEQIVLCWFSSKNGISKSRTENRKGDYKKITVNTSQFGILPKPTIHHMDQASKNPEAIKYGLYYRMPGNIEFSIRYDKEEILRQQMQIAQNGIVIPLPVEYLIDRNFAIFFHPETGGLKRIVQNKE